MGLCGPMCPIDLKNPNKHCFVGFNPGRPSLFSSRVCQALRYNSPTAPAGPSRSSLFSRIRSASSQGCFASMVSFQAYCCYLCMLRLVTTTVLHFRCGTAVTLELEKIVSPARSFGFSYCLYSCMVTWQAFVKAQKTKAYFKRYQVKFKRRRGMCRTNY